MQLLSGDWFSFTPFATKRCFNMVFARTMMRPFTGKLGSKNRDRTQKTVTVPIGGPLSGMIDPPWRIKGVRYIF